ncbi:MAG: hypothetical protein D6806_14275 [Deltaproteobacteria bacterium]|nr:MAG: hypothetical protein D6806_14275 [Deltaproteobacteria bacterium]
MKNKKLLAVSLLVFPLFVPACDSGCKNPCRVDSGCPDFGGSYPLGVSVNLSECQDTGFVESLELVVTSMSNGDDIELIGSLRFGNYPIAGDMRGHVCQAEGSSFPLKYGVALAGSWATDEATHTDSISGEFLVASEGGTAVFCGQYVHVTRWQDDSCTDIVTLYTSPDLCD